MNSQPANQVMEQIKALAQISEDDGQLTRTFASPAMRRANELVGSWMLAAGMTVRTDAVGNLIGHYPSANPNGKTLLLGSHLDTVRDAGAFDGPLGVLVAIACVQQLNKAQLPFAIDVVGFGDEEGVRYQTAYLGSKALAGTFTPEDLKRTDAKGVSMADAIRAFGGKPDALASAKMDGKNLLGYVEVHIEQGPVLEQKDLAVGVVTAIAGQSRVKITFLGRAGHAGTVPMDLRKDALCAASEFVLAAESMALNRAGLVATVGEVAAFPGASNVIPGEVRLSLDVRHPDDAARVRACDELKLQSEEIARKRHVTVKWELVHQASAVVCDSKFVSMLEAAVKREQDEVPMLPSGAGHDGAAMAAITPTAMLFVRCNGGISHHPDEYATIDDIKIAIKVMNNFLEELSKSA